MSESEWMSAAQALQYIRVVQGIPEERARVELAELAGRGAVRSRAVCFKDDDGDLKVIQVDIAPERWLIDVGPAWWSYKEDLSLGEFRGLSFNRKDILSRYPLQPEEPKAGSGKRAAGGAKPKFDWDCIVGEVVRRVHEEGLPDSTRQFAEQLLAWCHENFADEEVPGDTALRSKLSKWLAPLKRAQ